MYLPVSEAGPPPVSSRKEVNFSLPAPEGEVVNIPASVSADEPDKDRSESEVRKPEDDSGLGHTSESSNYLEKQATGG